MSHFCCYCLGRLHPCSHLSSLRRERERVLLRRIVSALATAAAHVRASQRIRPFNVRILIVGFKVGNICTILLIIWDDAPFHFWPQTVWFKVWWFLLFWWYYLEKQYPFWCVPCHRSGASGWKFEVILIYNHIWGYIQGLDLGQVKLRVNYMVRIPGQI